MIAASQTALSADHPFPGLRPYALGDSPFYFGREDQIFSLYRLLDRSRFIAVVGSSGSGKSSLVRAGLLPLLDAEAKNAGGRAWRWVEMRPGDAPLKRLVAALASLLPDAEDDVGRAVNAARRERIDFALRQSSFGLVEALDKIEGLGESSFVLVIDQFEELFRYASPPTSHRAGPDAEVLWREDAAHFVQLLLEVSRNRTRAVQVVITMRSDFIGDCARFHGLPEAVSATQYLVPSLTRDQREEVIRKPIEKAGATIDPTLVERLLNDSGDELDQLPVVQHCLMRLWDRAGVDAKVSASAGSDAGGAQAQPPATRHLTLEHYRAIGGIAGALSQHAEEVLASLAGLDLAVEQVFRALAEIDREGRAIRRAVPFAQLLAETGVPENQLRKVVDRLRAQDCSFLVPSPSTVPGLAPDTRIDVGHEALLRRWERLSGDPVIADAGTAESRQTGWLRKEDEDGRLYRGLLAFVDSGGSGGTTLPLEEVESLWKWWTSRPRTEAWTERYGGGFARVQGLFERSLAALKAAREAAKRQVVAQRRWRRSMIGGLVLLLAGAIAVALYTNSQRKAAVEAQLVAVDAEREALKQKDIASSALASATETANALVLEFAREFGDSGMPASMVLKILERARELQSKLEQSGVTTPELMYGKAVALNELAATLANAGESVRGVAAGEEARAILEELLRQQPDNVQWQLGLAESHHAIGYALHSGQQYRRTFEPFRKALAIRTKLADTNPGNAKWQSLVAESHSAVGDALLALRRKPEARESYSKSFAIRERLVKDAPAEARWQAKLSSSYGEVASALPDEQRGEKRDLFRGCVELAETAIAADPDNTQWQRDLSYCYAYLGTELVAANEYEAGLDAAKKSMELVDDLLKGDSKNVRWQKAFLFVYKQAKVAFAVAGRQEKAREIDEQIVAFEKRRAASDAGKKR
jgi:tetratricopeptide (TPR) repeat protein